MKLQSSWRMGLLEVIAGKYSFCKVSHLLQNVLSLWVRQKITSPPCSPKERWMVLEEHPSSWIQLRTNCHHETQGVTGTVTLNVSMQFLLRTVSFMPWKPKSDISRTVSTFYVGSTELQLPLFLQEKSVKIPLSFTNLSIVRAQC